MAIETIGSMNNVLKSFNADDWVKSANLEVDKSFEMNEAPSLELKQAPKSFSDLLAESINEVNQLQVDANKATENLVTGRSKNLHEVMLKVEQANLAFQQMNQVRLKVLEAYKEIMRMQL